MRPLDAVQQRDSPHSRHFPVSCGSTKPPPEPTLHHPRSMPQVSPSVNRARDWPTANTQISHKAEGLESPIPLCTSRSPSRSPM